jgi:hypothetical protein
MAAMQRQRVRRIPVAEPHNVWLRVRSDARHLYFQTLFGDISLYIPDIKRNLVSVGGVAGMVGSGMWITLFTLLQLQVILASALRIKNDRLMAAVYDALSFLQNDQRVVVVPLLLFILATLGLYACLQNTSSKIAKCGLFLVLLGLALSTWLGTFMNTYVCCDSFATLWRLFSVILFCDFFISLGVLLLGLPLIKERVLPKRGILFLIMSVWAMQFILYLMISLQYIPFHSLMIFLQYIPFHIEYFSFHDFLAQYGILTASALLFGASWTWLGMEMWSKRNSDWGEA